jgi:hypothetical protein
VRLVVEVDGQYHEQRARHDAARDRALGKLGWHLLRVAEQQVLVTSMPSSPASPNPQAASRRAAGEVPRVWLAAAPRRRTDGYVEFPPGTYRMRAWGAACAPFPSAG